MPAAASPRSTKLSAERTVLPEAREADDSHLRPREIRRYERQGRDNQRLDAPVGEVSRFDTERRKHPGDVILLIQGGHGFEVLEEVEMIEVKQGPYVGERDKTRFVGIEQSQVKLPK